MSDSDSIRSNISHQSEIHHNQPYCCHDYDSKNKKRFRIKKQIIVYILTSEPHCKRSKRLKKLFNREDFIVHTSNIPPPVGIINNDEISAPQAVEAYRINKV